MMPLLHLCFLYRPLCIAIEVYSPKQTKKSITSLLLGSLIQLHVVLKNFIMRCDRTLNAIKNNVDHKHMVELL